MNPFVEIWQDPVTALTRFAYVAILFGMLVMTWWAAGRNALYLRDQFQNGWLMLVPFWYALRTLAMLAILAVDLLLLAGIIYTLP